MNITKEIAKQATLKLLEGKKTKLEVMKESLHQKVRQLYLKQLPKEIMGLADKHLGYLKTSNSIKIIGTGFNHDIIRINPGVITDNKHYGHTFLSVSDSVAKTLLAQFRELDKAQDKYKDSLAKIESTLLSLRTYKRITEMFPEAAAFLPEVKKTELININQVRALLK